MHTSKELIIDRFLKIRESVHELEKKYGRSPGSVKILAASKGQSVEIIQSLAEAGCKDFGENFVQEAVPKIKILKSFGLAWHFIGRIQCNKIRLIAENFDSVHSISAIDIAKRFDKARPFYLDKLKIHIQVNLAASGKKAGACESDVSSMVKMITSLHQLKLEGLMTILDEDCLPAQTAQLFESLAQCLEKINLQQHLHLTELSMGMSNDYKIAIEKGSTCIRLGRTIFKI